jgi:methylmalonyl-CoA mutase N-terminal domain/subunit
MNRRIVVGVNAHEEDESAIEGLMRVEPVVGERQRARLQELRAGRDGERVQQLLGRLEEAAAGTDNLIPLLIECVEGDTTLGEICGVLRRVWGEYRGAPAV